MNGIVKELQRDILNKDCDIINSLRKAHIIASKLNLTEFDNWINFELNGYKDRNDVPSYRYVDGVLKAFNPYIGWIPTAISDYDFEKTITHHKVSESVSSIIKLIEQNKEICINFNGETQNLLDKMFGGYGFQYSVFIGKNQFSDIIEKIKNTLLEWTLDLEKNGIVGENLEFNEKEKEKAEKTQIIYNYYGNTFPNSKIESSMIITNGGNFYNDKFMNELKDTLKNEEIAQEDKSEIESQLQNIEGLLNANKKPTIIKSFLVGLKDFCISVGASVTAALIEKNIK